MPLNSNSNIAIQQIYEIMFGRFICLYYLAIMLRLILNLLKPKPPDVSQGEYNQLIEYCNELLEENIKLQIENQNLKKLYQN